MMDIKNKKVTILGAVRSGVGAAKLVKKLGGIPFVSDNSDNERLKESAKQLEENNIDYEFGGHTEKVFDCDLMVVSPGIPLDAPIIMDAKSLNLKMISEIELAYNFCKGKIIAVTGTNGKTTTTSLVAHIFNTANLKCYEAGNIGTAFSEVALNVKENEFVALEVSSFQLDLIDVFKPDAAMILNITPDHLYRYDNKFENYIDSKLQITRNQVETNYLILNYDDENISQAYKSGNSKVLYFSLNADQANGCSLIDEKIVYKTNGKVEFECPTSEMIIRGEHNIMNTMAAICAAKSFGVDNKNLLDALKSFKGVEHRLELVREIGGVKYINDSKATNVESVWYALKSFSEPLFLILGGQEKGNDYNKIKDLVIEKVKKIYAIGSSSDKIFNFFHSVVKTEVKKTLEDAVMTANSEARKGDIVLLSPACKSFDQFTSYEHRGEVFKKVVNKL